MRSKLYFLWIILALALNGCLSAQAGPATLTPSEIKQQPAQTAKSSSPAVTVLAPTASQTPANLAVQPTHTGLPEGSPTGTPAARQASPTTPSTLGPDEWQELPIVPQVSESVRKIFQRGLELGNNPQAFSKIGDCGSTPAWFLGDFDRGPKYYQLGEFQYLQPVIEAYQGSYGRTSLAAKSGFNASSVFTILWSNREMCGANETPIACEYRLHQPAIAFITLGSNDVFHQEKFEPQLRNIIEFSIEQGVIPILSTKADNLEKDGSINATIARLAREYDLPLWNYWLAVQPLPDHGLQEDGVHLTWGPNRFDDPQVMATAWTVRNLTALQTLDAVWRYTTGQPPIQP
jgi:hypothetical protein